MKLARLMVFLLAALSSLLLSGCWNYHDIEKSSIVAGMAVDKSKQGDGYIITAEIIDFETSGKEVKSTPRFIEAEGSTVFDAIRNIINVAGMKLFWAHATLVILSQDIAREGVAPVIDLMFRDAEMREEMDVVIAKGMQAGELLEEPVVVSEMHAFEIDHILKNQKSISESHKVSVYELVDLLEGDGISAALPAFAVAENDGNTTSVLAGTAVFKSDKLIGYLDILESKFYSFVVDKIDKGVLIEKEGHENTKDTVTLEIFKSKTKVLPVYSDGKLAMDIKISTEVAVGEIEGSFDYIDEAGRAILKKDAEEALKASVEGVIKKVQNDFDSDIFGFGSLVKAYIPTLWKEIKPDWDNLFKKLDVTVTVDITIRNSAIASKTIKKGE